MIITIAGKLGSGKSTIAKLLAKKLGFKHYSMGDFMGSLAMERGLSVLELSKLGESDKSIDEEIDKRQVELGKKEDNFVIDSRLGFHFIPNSVKIYLDVDEDVAVKRIFGDSDSRVDEKENTSVDNTKIAMSKRASSEDLRYQKYYGLNTHDHNNYDLLIDTSEDTPETIVSNILKFLETNA